MDASATSPLARTLPLQIAERIARLIVEERLAPGERLRETALARDFEVSRATIREALRLLEQRHLVLIVPQRGAQVAKLSRKELEDLFEIRAVLLGLVSRRVAAARGADARPVLDAGYTRLEAAESDPNAYARASADLVAELTRLCDNDQLASYIADFALRIGRYARLGLIRPERRAQSLVEWKALLEAIYAGDPERTEILHRRLSTQNLVAAVAELQRRDHDGTAEGANATGG